MYIIYKKSIKYCYLSESFVALVSTWGLLIGFQ